MLTHLGNKKITEFSKLESFYREWCSNQSVSTENEAIYRFLDSRLWNYTAGYNSEARRIFRFSLPIGLHRIFCKFIFFYTFPYVDNSLSLPSMETPFRHQSDILVNVPHSHIKEKEALDKLTHLFQSCKQQRGIIRSYSESYRKHPDWSWRGTWEQNGSEKETTRSHPNLPQRYTLKHFFPP